MFVKSNTRGLKIQISNISILIVIVEVKSQMDNNCVGGEEVLLSTLWRYIFNACPIFQSGVILHFASCVPFLLIFLYFFPPWSEKLSAPKAKQEFNSVTNFLPAHHKFIPFYRVVASLKGVFE